jgi:hypothetical protein
MIKWRDLNKEKPKNYDRCLTQTPSGIIESTYNAPKNNFSNQLGAFGTLYWSTTEWVPLSEVLGDE